MGDSELMESLDSLWFFSNVLAEPRTVTTITQVEPPQKHVDPVVQNDHSPHPETVTVKCPKCGEMSAEVESLQKETPAIVAVSQETENSSSRKEAKKKKRRSKRKILGEIEVEYYKDRGRFMEESVESCGFGSVMSPIYQKNMPPLNDGLAMKQHLKSWAYAVACTVR